MKEKACNFISKRSGKKIFVTDSLKLTPDQIWIRDEAYDENGGYVFGHKAKIHHKLMRCRTFKGWFAIRQDNGKEGTKEEKYDFVGNLTLHDQGWRKRVIRPDGTPTPYTVELSQVVFEKRGGFTFVHDLEGGAGQVPTKLPRCKDMAEFYAPSRTPSRP